MQHSCRRSAPNVPIVSGRVMANSPLGITVLKVATAFAHLVAFEDPAIVNLSLAPRDNELICPYCKRAVSVEAFHSLILPFLFRLVGDTTTTVMAAGNRRQFSNARHALAETSSLVLVEAQTLKVHWQAIPTGWIPATQLWRGRLAGKIRREQRLRRSSRTHPAVSGPRTPPHSSAPLRSLTGAPTWVRRGSTCRPGSKTSARSADRSLTCRWTLLLRLFLQMRRSRRCNLPRRDDDRHRDDAALLAHLHIGCVEPDIWPVALQRPGEEGPHLVRTSRRMTSGCANRRAPFGVSVLAFFNRCAHTQRCPEFSFISQRS